MPESDAKTGDNVFKGAILIIISVFMIASMNAVGKYLAGQHMNPLEITFYRNLTVLIGFSAYLQFSKQWHILKTNNMKDQIYRAVVGTCGVVTGFWAISKLPLADATTLLYTAPLFVTLLSYPMLKEKVGIFRGCAVLVGFVGIIIVAAPTGQDLSMTGVALGLIAAFFNALTQLQLRKLGRNENPFTTVFYFMLFGTIMTGLLMPAVFTEPPAYSIYPFILLLGATGILQQVLKTIGYSIAPTAIVTPLNYFGLLWAVLIGFAIWGEVPTATVYAGSGIIIASNLFILWREQYLKKKGRNIPPADPISE